jgi:hypothetical protein
LMVPGIRCAQETETSPNPITRHTPSPISQMEAEDDEDRAGPQSPSIPPNNTPTAPPIPAVAGQGVPFGAREYQPPQL